MTEVTPNSMDVSDVVESDQSRNTKLQEQSKTEKFKHVNLPLSRIKQIIKMDPEVKLASADAVFLIAKSAEKFIATFSREAHVFTAAAKKKTVQRRDVDSAIESIENFVFLEGALD